MPIPTAAGHGFSPPPASSAGSRDELHQHGFQHYFDPRRLRATRAQHLSGRHQQGRSQGSLHASRRGLRGLSRRGWSPRSAARAQTEGFRRRDQCDAGSDQEVFPKLPTDRPSFRARPRTNRTRNRRSRNLSRRKRRCREDAARRNGHRRRTRGAGQRVWHAGRGTRGGATSRSTASTTTSRISRWSTTPAAWRI